MQGPEGGQREQAALLMPALLIRLLLQLLTPRQCRR